MTGEPLGLERGAVRLVDYDPRWPALFAAERRRLRALCGSLPLRLEHIGGTAIPGLCAKPILDIAAGRPGDVPVEQYVEALERAGYEHRGEQGIPGRAYFRRGDPRAYHLHLVIEHGSLWREYLAFRDYLRTHDAAARRFAAVKRTLAGRFVHDREGYMHAKAPYVQEILRDAETLTAGGGAAHVAYDAPGRGRR